MDRQEELELAIQAARELRDQYARISERALPDSLSEAISGGWDVDLSGLEVDLPDLSYTDREREADNNRVLSLKRAVEITGEFEEELLREVCRSPARLLLRKIRKYRAIVTALLKYGDEVAGLIMDAAGDLIEELKNVNWNNWLEGLGEVRAAIAAAIAAVATGAFLAAVAMCAKMVREATESCSMVAWAEMVAAIGNERRKIQSRMDKGAFPQRAGLRVWRRKEARL